MDFDLGTALVAGLIAGLACGLVPLIYGAMRGRLPLGLAGLAACAVAGLILGLILAIPVAAVFTFLIYRQTRGEPRTGTA